MKGERVIVAIDFFKGSLTSRQANQAASEALLEYGLSEAEIECIEVSDGREGFLDAVPDCVPVTVCPVQAPQQTSLRLMTSILISPRQTSAEPSFRLFHRE